MARSRSLISTLVAVGRAQAAAARRAEAAQKRAIRNELLSLRDQAKQAKREYLDLRTTQTIDLNQDVADQLKLVETCLASALALRVRLSFQSEQRRPASEADLYLQKNPYPEAPRLMGPQPLGWLSQKFTWTAKRHESRVQLALEEFEAKQRSFDEEITRIRIAADQIRSAAEKHNEELLREERIFAAGEPTVVAKNVEAVLLEHNADYIVSAAVSFSRDSNLLVVEVDALSVGDIVPAAETFSYRKVNDEIVEKPRSAKNAKMIYLDYISQLALRITHVIFSAIRSYEIVETLALSLFVNSTDKATGLDVRPCLVSVRITRDQFAAINLGRVDPLTCLKLMQAAVSRDPSELVPVKPVSRLNMQDKRFIEEQDILSSMDNRINLMDLSPNEFESLITNLFAKMGLETRLTQASRDGGVDCVAFDLRPVLGGKVIIQAKRYKNTVGVSAVRDLFGTVHNEGASKGILVSTSGYGKATYEFANGKPLELIDGAALLYLLKEHAGLDATIVMPEIWVDPIGA